jgi:ABC-2 type transport system permease protein
LGFLKKEVYSFSEIPTVLGRERSSLLNEIIKTFSKKITIIALLCFIAIVVIFTFSWLRNVDEFTVLDIIRGTLGPISMILIIPWSMIIPPMLFMDEYQYHTLKQLFLHAPSRISVYFYKFLGMTVHITLFIACLFAVPLVMTLVATPINITWGVVMNVLFLEWSLIQQCVLYSSLVVMIGIWTKSAAVAVGLGQGIYFIQLLFEEYLLSQQWSHFLFIHHDDLSVYLKALDLSSGRLDFPISLSKNIGYILLFLLLGLWKFLKRDVV